MIKIIGYALFLLSCLLWALVFIIPWFDFSKSQIAGILTVLIIAGEITFYLSIIILGKSLILKMKSRFKFWKAKTGDTNFTEQNTQS